VTEDLTSVRVADGRNVQIRGKLSLIIGFENNNGEFISATLKLRVLEGLFSSFSYWYCINCCPFQGSFYLDATDCSWVGQIYFRG